MSDEIRMDFTLIETYAEKIRRPAERLGSLPCDNGQVPKDTYTNVEVVQDSLSNYERLIKMVRIIEKRLLEDCSNLDKIAEMFEAEDKEVSLQYQVNFQSKHFDEHGLL